MPLILFSFSFNPETQEAAIAGNCEPMVALQLLQQLVVAQLVKNAHKRGDNSGQEKSSNQEEEATKATEKDN